MPTTSNKPEELPSVIEYLSDTKIGEGVYLNVMQWQAVRAWIRDYSNIKAIFHKNAALKEASESKCMIYHDGHNKVDTNIHHTALGEDHVRIDQQMILNIYPDDLIK